MTEHERPPYLPELSTPWAIDDFVPAAPAPMEAPAPVPSPAPAADQADRAATADAEPAPRPRVTLRGRVGALPAFRTTPNGVLIARFPLAVPGEDKRTTWHQVLAFKQRAERVRESVQRGDAVEVIGYTHEREQRRRDGSVRTVEEIYAVVIKPQQSRER
jgi:hypothetical protein